MLDLIKSNSHVLVAALWALVEFYLGKTDKIKAGSVLELIVNFVRSAVQKFLGNDQTPPAAK